MRQKQSSTRPLSKSGLPVQPASNAASSAPFANQDSTVASPAYLGGAGLDVSQEVIVLPPRARNVLRAATALVAKMIAAPFAATSERASLLKLLRALKRFPAVPTGSYFDATLMKEPRACVLDDEHGLITRFWEVTAESEGITIVSGGVVSFPDVGSDSFECLRWQWLPTLDPEFDFVEHHRSFRVLPGIKAFDEEVREVDLTAPGWFIDVTDDDNAALPTFKRPDWEKRGTAA